MVRSFGGKVIYVWFVCEVGYLMFNWYCVFYDGFVFFNVMVCGIYGVVLVLGFELNLNDLVVEKMLMNLFEISWFESYLCYGGYDIVINIGVWINMFVEYIV